MAAARRNDGSGGSRKRAVWQRGGETQKVEAAAAFLRAQGAGECRLALVLGSGWKAFAAELAEPVALPFAAVPHWPTPAVPGHGGQLVLGRIGCARVACLTGRVHLYEGHAPADVVRAVRSLYKAGVRRFLLTNAAGGIGGHLRVGDLMRIKDHLNLTGSSPLLGAHEPALGPRFSDQSAVWSGELAARLQAGDQELKEGVYAGLSGPSYETPAEVAMLRVLGADAVGMSTVHEAIALRALGAEIAGLSLISNLAAGIADRPLGHDEVISQGERARARCARLLVSLCAAL
jgi:purine-nucleoside phosphorylase